MSVDFPYVSVSHLWLTKFSSPKSNDANTHDKYLRLEVDFDVDVFLTLVFYFIIILAKGHAC